MHESDGDALALDDADIEGRLSGDVVEGAGAWDEGIPYDDEVEPDEAALEELTAVEAAEAEASRAALEDERARSRAVLQRYRELLLASEPGLSADLVQGDTLEELDAALEVARGAAAETRAALDGVPVVERGFPVGAPARERSSTAGLSASEKIRRGLEDRMRTR